MTSKAPESIIRWLRQTPDAITLVLLVGAVSSAVAVHVRLSVLEAEVREIHRDVDEMSEVITGRITRR